MRLPADAADRPPPSRLTTFLRGATGACPVCGRRRGVTTGWWTIAERCPGCGFRFERKPGHFVGAVGINTIVTFGLLLVTMVVGLTITWPEVAAVPLLVAGLGVALVFPVLYHPLARTTWVAVDLIMVPIEPGEAPGVAEEGASQQR